MEAAAQTVFDGEAAPGDGADWGEPPVRPSASAFTRSGGDRDRLTDRFAATPIFAEMLGAWDGPCAELLARA